MQRRRRTKSRFVRDERESTQDLAVLMRALDQTRNAIQADDDRMAADREYLAAINRSLDEIETSQDGDARSNEAVARLERLNSWWWPLLTKARLAMKRLGRVVVQELFYAALIPLRLIVLVLLHVAWFSLLLFFLTL